MAALEGSTARVNICRDLSEWVVGLTNCEFIWTNVTVNAPGPKKNREIGVTYEAEFQAQTHEASPMVILQDSAPDDPGVFGGAETRRLHPT